MEITSVKVHKTEREGSRMKGYATVTLDDCFVVRNIRIIQGEDKLFIAMPSRKVADDKYEDIAHPINAETRKMFEDKIIAEYENPTEVEE
jgi:stage V sporulation protein G